MIPIINGTFNGLRNSIQGIHKRLVNYLAYFGAYLSRVTSDGGTISNQNLTREYFRMCEQNGISRSILLAVFAGSGAKFRTSTIYSYFSKLYSFFGTNDAVQSTDLNQPYLSGNIAPNERYAMLNPNGSGRLIVHPTISFGASDPWSLTLVINWFGYYAYSQFFASNGSTNYLYLKTSNGNRIQALLNGTYIFADKSTNKIIGKNSILHLVAGGDNSLKAYIGGEEIALTSAGTTTAMSLSILMQSVFGKILSYTLRNIALTQSQITAEANFFRSIYPEIPSVVIGTQEWATSNLDVVCTPQGNVINEITDNANVENLVNGTFETTQNNTSVGNHSSAIVSDDELSSNVLEVTASGAGANNTNSVYWVTVPTQLLVNPTSNANKYYKITIKAKSISGNTTLNCQNSSGLVIGTATITSTWTTYTYYYKQGSGGSALILFLGGAGVFRIENFSQQLVGWSGLTEVYDAIYAATSGSAAVKDRAGCLAAAAWCHYNNDSANGAIYGKLYNWYAARTLQYDIDAYNAANPSTPWGWRVPTQADFTAIQTTLGGSTVAGGKMKKEGLSYWNTPNAGADNSIGFTSLPGGLRNEITGLPQGLGLYSNSWTQNLKSAAVAYGFGDLNTDASFILLDGIDVRRGMRIRLIKA